MLSHETAVCKLFGEKRDVSFISKRALINGIANLNADYEILYVDLYEVAPNHDRFKNWTDEQRADIERRINERKQ